MKFDWLREVKYLWYYPAMIIIITALGVFSTVYVYFKINEFEKKSLQKRSQTLSEALETGRLDSLSGSELDLSNPDYISLKEKLAGIKKVNPDVRFVYLAGTRDNRIYFIADSEDPESEGYSPPGQAYPEASDEFLSIFEKGESILEGPVSDRWGSWISALSPLKDPETQKVIAVVGLDIEAANYLKTVWLYSSLPLFVTLLLVFLVAIGWVIKKEEEKIVALKAEFVAMASHDIRSPVGKILWALEAQFSKTADNLTAAQKEALGYVERGCRNLLGTINDYLLATSLESRRASRLFVTQCNFAEILQKAAAVAEPGIRGKNIRLKMEVPENVTVRCDLEKMKRVVANVIDNAVKYSKNNSEIEVAYHKEKDLHIFSVEDHGIGIASADKENIFKGFFRAENAKKITEIGTGLGLYYAKKVIDLHGGKIWFDSKEGEGTTFHIALK